MKNKYKSNVILVMFLVLLLRSEVTFSDGIWFKAKNSYRVNDGSVSQELHLSSDHDLSKDYMRDVIVFGSEAESKWHKDYHKGIFLLKKVLHKEKTRTYIVNSRHPIRYEFKAVSTFITKRDKMIVMGAKINIFLYGQRSFDPQERDHEFVDTDEPAFSLDIVDKNASSNYWIKVGQRLNIGTIFLKEPLVNKSVNFFINNSFYGKFKTDDNGKLSFVLPSPENGVFQHSRDVCHYHLEVEHEYEDTTYISTLTILVHPERIVNTPIAGFSTLIGTMGIAVLFVIVRRKKKQVG